MSVVITIRNVPEAVRDELAARAARSGRSTDEYLRLLLIEVASRPSLDDVIVRARARVNVSRSRVETAASLAARDSDRR